jgi:uncharacterized protein (UPF0332 family)
MGMANDFSEKSQATWDAGMKCLEYGLVNAATNRIYYAVFQAIKGFAIFKRYWTLDESDNLHSKAMKIIYDPQVGDKGMPYRRKFSELRGLRVIADYMPENVKEEDLKALIGDADTIRRYYISKAN